MSVGSTNEPAEEAEYKNVWPLIEGKTAREIAGFDSEHYEFWGTHAENDETSVRILQIEFDIFDDHPSLNKKVKRLFGEERDDYYYRYHSLDYAIHGTASASMITDTEKGVAPGAALYFTGVSKAGLIDCESHNPYEILPIIRRVREENANSLLQPGDVISISIQLSQEDSNGKRFNFPLDANASVQEELNQLSEMGYIVFIAAGNSRLNLDSEVIIDADLGKQSYARLSRDSLAVKVGYTGMSSWNRHWSNFGDAVDFFAPTGSVSAACYDYDANIRRSDLIDTFVGGFGKTSAATPIIAAIAAKVQRMNKMITGNHLNREELLRVLKSCGNDPKACSVADENNKPVGCLPCATKIRDYFAQLEKEQKRTA